MNDVKDVGKNGVGGEKNSHSSDEVITILENYRNLLSKLLAEKNKLSSGYQTKLKRSPTTKVFQSGTN